MSNGRDLVLRVRAAFWYSALVVPACATLCDAQLRILWTLHVQS